MAQPTPVIMTSLDVQKVHQTHHKYKNAITIQLAILLLNIASLIVQKAFLVVKKQQKRMIFITAILVELHLLMF